MELILKKYGFTTSFFVSDITTNYYYSKGLLKQNETIAHGMVAIAEKLDNFIQNNNPMPKVTATAQHTMGMPQQSRVAPPINTAFPPPPPRVERKKHNLNLFK